MSHILWLGLILLNLQPFAFGQSQTVRLPYWQKVLKTVKSGDLSALERILSEPPPTLTSPLANAHGGMTLAAFELILKQNTNDDAETAGKLVEKIFEMGADPMKIAPYSDNPDEMPMGKEALSGVEVALEQWVTLLYNYPVDNHEEINHRFKLGFDILFKKTNFYPEKTVILRTSETPTEWYQRNLVQFAIEVKRPELRDYFLGKMSKEVLNTHQHSTAMTAAIAGDLDSLKALLNKWGPTESARLFNFKTPNLYQPTVLHMAVASVEAQKTSGDIIEIIDFLTSHGADPSQKSMYHDLFQEAEYQGSLTQDSSKQSEYRKLASELRAAMSHFKSNFERSKTRSQESMRTNNQNSGADGIEMCKQSIK